MRPGRGRHDLAVRSNVRIYARAARRMNSASLELMSKGKILTDPIITHTSSSTGSTDAFHTYTERIGNASGRDPR